MFVIKTNQVLRPFSVATEQYASKEDQMIKLPR